MKKLSIHLMVCALFFSATLTVRSQPQPISTVAGYAGKSGTDGVGSSARFNHPHGMAIDANGNIYVADTLNHTIRKITPGGAVITIAGFAGVSGSVNDFGSNARFNKPEGVAVDGAGNIYVADTGNHTIRQIAPNGLVSTIAGQAGVSGNQTGSGANARFNQPIGIAVGNSGVLYIADYGNGVVRQISGGVVSTFAVVTAPEGLTVGSGGVVYVAEHGSSTILKISSGGSISTLAGNAYTYGSSDGSGTNAVFNYPAAVAVDSGGTVYAADSLNHTVRKITSLGAVSTFAGRAGVSGYSNGTGTNAFFNQPHGIVVDATLNVYVSDTENGSIRKITPAGVVTTFAGSASASFADGKRGAVRFAMPLGVAADVGGIIYIADTQNSVIRAMTPNGQVATVAGFPGVFGSVNGSVTNAQFNAPQGIAVDSSGNLYVADTGNSLIRKIGLGGTVTTLAGSTGNQGYVDGTGTAAEFNQPRGVAIGTSGNIYVADTLNHVIRQISSGGVVTSIAGLGENYGSADGTNSTARFNHPSGIATDGQGNIYVADSLNHTIRRITSSGPNRVTTTIAGYPGLSGSVDGTNNTARFFAPRAVAVDGLLNVYVVDSGNHALRKITPNGTNWVVTTIAGSAGLNGSADGVGSAVRFDDPIGLTIDASGFLYVADAANNTIRVNRILPPQLQLAYSAGTMVLSWSVLASGYTLEASSVLSPGTWNPINSWAVVGDNYVFTNNATVGNAFFRLRQ